MRKLCGAVITMAPDNGHPQTPPSKLYQGTGEKSVVRERPLYIIRGLGGSYRDRLG